MDLDELLRMNRPPDDFSLSHRDIARLFWKYRGALKSHERDRAFWEATVQNLETAYRKLSEAEERFRLLIQNFRGIVYQITPSAFRPLFFLGNVEEITGYGPEVFESGELTWDGIVHHDDLPILREERDKLLSSPGYVANCEYRIRHRDGEIRWVNDIAQRTGFGSEGADVVQGSIFDITHRKELEDELLKMHKLESLGLLAGGIAHDFNNILAAVLGNINLALLDTKPGGELHNKLREAEKASIRAKDLTRQLLTFSKGGAPIKKTISIRDLVRDSTGFALRGSNVRCRFLLPEELWPVDVDEGQMSQVINNLVINADQAMPDGGDIEISAENLLANAVGRPSIPAGNLVKITVQDHGVGISEENLGRIFDPYFTTKEQGSGLGLAISYSIVKRHDGAIEAESRAGVGTAFHIYLPASEKRTARKRSVSEGIIPGQGRILFMDDEESVRSVADAMLKVAGYTTAFARNGREAIARYEEANKSGQPFDAVILDLTIPGGMGGEETVSILRQIDPRVKAIVMSGYSESPVMANYRKYGFVDMMTKPFEISELSRKLHSALKGVAG